MIYRDFKPGVSETLRRAFSVTDGTEFPVAQMRKNEVDFAVKNRVVYTFARPSRRPGEPPRMVIEAVELASKDGRTTALLTLPSAPRVRSMVEVDTPSRDHQGRHRRFGTAGSGDGSRGSSPRHDAGVSSRRNPTIAIARAHVVHRRMLGSTRE